MSGSERTFSRRDMSIIAGLWLLLLGAVLFFAAIVFFSRGVPLSGTVLLYCSATYGIVGLRLIAGSSAALVALGLIVLGFVGLIVGGLNSWHAAQIEGELGVSDLHEAQEKWGHSDAQVQELERAGSRCGYILLGILLPIGAVILRRQMHLRNERYFWPDVRG